MPADTSTTSNERRFLSLDSWVLVIAFALALAVKFNLWPSIPW